MMLAVAGMVTLASCGGDKKDGESSESNKDSVENKAEEPKEAVEETTISSSSEMQFDDLTPDKDGNLRDASGKIVKTYQEALEAYGDEYKKAIEAYREAYSNVPGMGQAIDQAVDEYQKAVDEGMDEYQKALDKSMDEYQKALDEVEL